MKIALVTPRFCQPRGNTITVQRISKGLQALGVSVEIVSIEEKAYPELPEVDLVHGFNAYQFNQYWKKKGDTIRPYLVTLTGTDLNESLFKDSTKEDVLQALLGAKAIHVFNEKAREMLLKEVPEIKAKTFMIPQGITTFQPDSLFIKKEPGTFLFLLPAGIRKVKNVPKAISMLAQLHKKYPFFRLWIVGPMIEEEEGQSVLKLTEEYGNWVRYLGQVPHHNMGELYHCSDIILNTSLSEGQSSAILEAMAKGLPVVASDIPGNRDILKNGQTGFLFRDEQDFGRIVERLVENRNLLKKVGHAAKDYVLTHHSVKKEIQALFSIYRHILNKSFQQDD